MKRLEITIMGFEKEIKMIVELENLYTQAEKIVAPERSKENILKVIDFELDLLKRCLTHDLGVLEYEKLRK